MSSETINICICTYRRAHLADTLRTIFAQNVPPGLAVRVIVADNDAEPSAEAMVEKLAADAPFPVQYVHAPERNISIARNACLDHADGNWVAFIDDDETAPPDWIVTLWNAAREGGVDVMFGPAIAQYPDGTPDWIRAGDYHTNRVPVHDGQISTGHTCNVLMRWADSPIRHERFLLENGRTGGEDVEFFFRITRMGLRLGKCDAAKVFESTGKNRLDYGWIRRRRFAAGQFHGAYAQNAGAGFAQRLALLSGSAAKFAISMVAAVAMVWSPPRHRQWVIRSFFHAGVCAAVLGIKQAELY